MAVSYKKGAESVKAKAASVWKGEPFVMAEEEAKDNTPKPVADHASESYSASLPHGGGIIEELKTAMGTSLVKHKDGSEESKSEQIAVASVKGPMANIGVKMARTINTGNYESAKIEVSLYAPAEMTQEDLDTTFEQAVSWVDGKMSELVGKYTKE